MEYETRREFLRRAIWGCAAAGVVQPLADCLGAMSATGRGGMSRRETPEALYDKLPDQATRCGICPKKCLLSPGQRSACHTRVNENGRLTSHAYGNPCILNVDPVEKLPLAHFLPGSSALALATGGCNLQCMYCQNWQQSQAEPETLRTFDLMPDKAVEGAKKRDLRAVAFTYTDPVAFYEYCYDVASEARAAHLRTVVCSGLYINPAPVRQLCRVTDAFVVTLKGFDEAFYQKAVGGELAPVLRALETVKNEGVWLEIINLVVPTYNDDLGKVRQMVHWIRQNLGEDVPLHFGRFVPEYRLKDLPRTPVPTLERCLEIGREELKYVYVFNLSPHPANNTVCPRCHKEIVTRLGFKVMENHVERGQCKFCQFRLPGIWT